MGMNFQYDDEGGHSSYFAVSFCAFLLLPFTFWVFKRGGEKVSKTKAKKQCFCELCIAKTRRLEASKPKKQAFQGVLYILVAVAWAGLAYAIYQVSQIESDHQDYDPYVILGVDRGSTLSEIKKAYRELSKTKHPDKGGDQETWIKITKANLALTNDESRKNYEEYGNPDGPGAMQHGIAMPQWLVEGNTSMWVLGTYVLVFMVIMPSIVGTWWYRSIKYSNDSVLLPTQRLFMFMINKTPSMNIKRAFLILGSSYEYWKHYNSEVVERESDDVEVRAVMRELPTHLLQEKLKEQPFCLPYSIKARALLLAHVHRLELPSSLLLSDIHLMLRKTPLLIHEMVQICAQLTSMARAGQVPRQPKLLTVESIMKLSPYFVQGLWEHASPLLMLPHINEFQLRSFRTKKIIVKSIRQFCDLKRAERRNLLKNIDDDHYRNIINVISGMPRITMDCDMKVLDDEDNTITAGAIVTVSVTLNRQPMLYDEEEDNAQKPMVESHEEENGALVPTIGVEHVGSMNSETPAEEEVQSEKKMEEEVVRGNAPKPWEKAKKKRSNDKKLSNNRQKQKDYRSKKKNPTSQANGNVKPEDAEKNEKGESQAKRKGESEGSDHESSGDERLTRDSDHDLLDSAESDEEDWVDIEGGTRKPKLEATSLISHTVHCPLFPDDKQEYWWLYLANKKTDELITVPVRITNLVDDLTISVKFAAPSRTGNYTFTMCLKSDSYIDCELMKVLPFKVRPAVVTEDHPQWKEVDEEMEENANSDEASSEYGEDSDEFEYDD